MGTFFSTKVQRALDRRDVDVLVALSKDFDWTSSTARETLENYAANTTDENLAFDTDLVSRCRLPIAVSELLFEAHHRHQVFLRAYKESTHTSAPRARAFLKHVMLGETDSIDAYLSAYSVLAFHEWFVMLHTDLDSVSTVTARMSDENNFRQQVAAYYASHGCFQVNGKARVRVGFDAYKSKCVAVDLNVLDSLIRSTEESADVLMRFVDLHGRMRGVKVSTPETCRVIAHLQSKFQLVQLPVPVVKFVSEHIDPERSLKLVRGRYQCPPSTTGGRADAPPPDEGEEGAV